MIVKSGKLRSVGQASSLSLFGSMPETQNRQAGSLSY